MLFYKIELHSFPRIKFAASVCTDRFKNIITARKDILEISVASGGDLVTELNGETHTRKSGAFATISPDANVRIQAAQNAPLYMSFAAIEGDFTCTEYAIDAPDACLAVLQAAPQSLFLPFEMQLGAALPEVERLFRLLIMEYLKETAAGSLRAVSLWLEIISTVSILFKESLEEDSPIKYGEYYARKIKRHVEAHYAEKLSVQEIANSLHITPNYLSRVFRSNTGKTISEFIAVTRLYHARRLAYEGTLTAHEIAKQVGLCDANYLNRLFRKYYGTGLHACRLVDRGISLYHDRPWEVENLTEDIYPQKHT